MLHKPNGVSHREELNMKSLTKTAHIYVYYILLRFKLGNFIRKSKEPLVSSTFCINEDVSFKVFILCISEHFH